MLAPGEGTGGERRAPRTKRWLSGVAVYARNLDVTFGGLYLRIGVPFSTTFISFGEHTSVSFAVRREIERGNTYNLLLPYMLRGYRYVWLHCPESNVGWLL